MFKNKTPHVTVLVGRITKSDQHGVLASRHYRHIFCALEDGRAYPIRMREKEDPIEPSVFELFHPDHYVQVTGEIRDGIFIADKAERTDPALEMIMALEADIAEISRRILADMPRPREHDPPRHAPPQGDAPITEKQLRESQYFRGLIAAILWTVGFALLALIAAVILRIR